MKRALPGVFLLSCIGLALIGSPPRSDAQEKVSTSLAATLHPAGAPAGSWAVAASSSTVVLGLSMAHTAYVYERNLGGPNHWGQGRTLGPTTADDQEFGWSVAISGDTIAVGDDRGGRISEGAVYIFERNRGGSGRWGQTKRIAAPEVSLLGGFGDAVAISGDTLVAGTSTLDTVYVLSRNKGGKGNWGVVKKLVGAPNSFFGTSVAVSGDLVLVGSYVQRAYLFNRTQGGANGWGLVKTFASPGFIPDDFGKSVAVSGTTVAIGAPRYTPVIPGTDTAAGGGVFVYGRNQGGPATWGLSAWLVSPDVGRVRNFGTSVAISGDVIVAGSPPDFGNGSACFFSRNVGGTNAWGPVTLWSSPTSTTFGSAAAISGDTAVVGQSGAASVFRINP